MTELIIMIQEENIKKNIQTGNIKEKPESEIIRNVSWLGTDIPM